MSISPTECVRCLSSLYIEVKDYPITALKKGGGYFKSRILVKIGISLSFYKTVSLGTIVINFYQNWFLPFISILTSQGAVDRYMFSDKNL